MIAVTGASHVEDLLAHAGHAVREVLVEAGGNAGRVIAMAEAAGVAWRRADRSELARVGGNDARLVVALMRPYEYSSLEEVIAGCGGRSCVLACDGVLDPGNLGAIVRNAAFFGVSGVILPEDRSAQVTQAVARRSAGALWKVRIAQVKNMVRAIGRLKEAGFWVYGTVVEGGKPLWSEAFPEKSCFVLGGEEKGVRRLVKEHCDVHLGLPGGFESLNVAAFSSVLLYEWMRQAKKTC